MKTASNYPDKISIHVLLELMPRLKGSGQTQ